MLLSFFFIGTQIMRYDIDFSILTSPMIIAGLLLMGLVYGINIIFVSFVFCWLLRVLSGAVVDRRLVVSIYCSSNLYKYLPGNIMHFVGRNRLAIEAKSLRHEQVMFTTLTEILFLCFSAAIISAICLFNFITELLPHIYIPSYVFAALGTVLIVVVIFSALFRRLLSKLLTRFFEIMKRFRPVTALKYLGLLILQLLVAATVYLMVLLLLGQPITADLVPMVIGLFVLSWLIGFLMPGAPGGLGVREAIMIMFLGGTINQNILVSSAVIHRVVCITGDLSAFGMSILYSKLRKGNTNFDNSLSL